jgi:L-seryl-tRNA(Ser) seleniumtransferase
LEDPRRHLPKVDRLCTPDLNQAFGAARVAACARMIVEEARAALARGESVDLDAIPQRLQNLLMRRIRPVINATGVVLHTNLGRAPWGKSAKEAANQAMGFSSVEMDLNSGKRGKRGSGVEDRICALTGAEAALVVNNGAAALFLCLRALARGKDVLVSRGELVEIGGGFRVPDIMAESDATLVEVGTTNRTHLHDFENALTENVAALLQVHHSNFKQVGFVKAPTLSELVGLGRPVILDQGSGALETIGNEPAVKEALKAGVELVVFSGDKLLGGPQAGFVVGKKTTVEKLKKHPLMRALRLDKVALAALEATLDDHLKNPDALSVRRMVQANLDDLRVEVERWQQALVPGVESEVVDVDGAVGGGSLPGETFPSIALRISKPEPDTLAQALLHSDPPIFGRIHKDALYLDARTVHPLGDGDALLAALNSALEKLS